MVFFNPHPRPVPHLTSPPPHSLWLVEVGKDVIIIKHPLSALSLDWGDGMDLCREQKLTANEVILKPSVVIYWLMKRRLAFPSLSAICHFFGTYIKCHWPLLEVSVTVSKWLSKHSSPLANVKSPNLVWPSLKNITIEPVLQYSYSKLSPSGWYAGSKGQDHTEYTANPSKTGVHSRIDWRRFGCNSKGKIMCYLTIPSFILYSKSPSLTLNSFPLLFFLMPVHFFWCLK